MFHPMSQAPTDPVLKAVTCPNEPLTYRVWHHRPYYSEDPTPWKCVAAFQYLQEALDYIAYCQDAGSDVVFQTPCDCKAIKATDRSVKYRPEPVPADWHERGTQYTSQAFQIIAGSPRRRPAPQYAS
jgi:hypothetical protein